MRQEQLVFHKTADGFTHRKSTPFHITLTGIARQTQNKAVARSAIFGR
ncbi:hypothetical protein M8494_30950 [Serratia ureilytica]